MNRKGKWSWIHTIASIVMILGFFGINEYTQLIPQINIIPDTLQNDTTDNQKIQPFDFSKTKIIGPKPIKENMYSGSNNLICYSFQNPTASVDSNFTLIAEWFLDNSLEPLEPEYEVILNYSEIINHGRLNWVFINNSQKVKFRTALKKDLKPISKEINYNLIDNEGIRDYLKKDEIVFWDDNIIREFIKETAICSKTNDEELAKELMGFVRSYMNPPAKTEDKIYYDNVTLNSLESWNNRIGTSSEYSVVYAMLLRSIGIPTKILSNPNDNFDYYFVEAYLNDAEWVPIDIYDEDKSVGDLFKKEILELRKNYYHITIKGLENIEFISLSTETPYNSWVSLRGTIKSHSDQKIEYLKVNITLLDDNYQLVHSDWTFLIDSEGLNPNNQPNIELNVFPKSLDNVKFINISKLE
ncbi:hypothetical protein DRN69_02805 [Candidatus Pacearchaeota archaeon]|nr:MAG: hypothetical protein DRN69_02805 [Candidatus Pacearchaeota archaeon]